MSQTFKELQLGGARVYRAPGRVNLIGEHTDYNEGFVMPAAIDLHTQVAIKPRSDRKLIIHSETFSDNVEFDLDEPNPRARGHWSDYARGVAIALQQAGYRIPGADLAIQSNVPIGAGLSSSAAIEVATGLALLKTRNQRNRDADTEIAVDRVELARLCQQAENEFVGMRCGIMDQFIACCGRAGKALMLDCRTLDYQLLPLSEDVRLVICNTMVKHELCSSEYNTRRAECEAGVQYFAQLLPGVQALRDVTVSDLESCGAGLNEVVYKRCRHVITENARVLEAAAALDRNDLDAFGRLMAESHRSLRDDYEVSCAELDTMVDLAASIEGVYGARMTGGGFGGSTINLVNSDAVREFKQTVARGYERATGFRPEIFVCLTADGVL